MRGFVLDASVALRWLLNNPVPAYAQRIRQRLIGGDRAVVLALWHLKISNGLVYLDLAQQQRLLLATLDERLRTAATRAGVELAH